MNPFTVLWDYREAFISGFVVTAELLVLAAILGTTLALLLEWLCERLEGAMRRAVDAVAFGISAIPALVILFWLHYPAQALFDIVVPAFWTAIVALTVINVFAIYRIVADAVRDLPKQYVSTALVCGLTRAEVRRYIKAPLLLRSAFPRWIDQQVVILQTSLFASLISVEESFRVAQRINSLVYQPVLIYTAMALIFLVTAGSAMYYARVLRAKFERDFSER